MRREREHGGDARGLRPPGAGTADRLGVRAPGFHGRRELAHRIVKTVRVDHKADLAIVAEPTGLNLVDCRKGALE